MSEWSQNGDRYVNQDGTVLGNRYGGAKARGPSAAAALDIAQTDGCLDDVPGNDRLVDAVEEIDDDRVRGWKTRARTRHAGTVTYRTTDESVVGRARIGPDGDVERVTFSLAPKREAVADAAGVERVNVKRPLKQRVDTDVAASLPEPPAALPETDCVTTWVETRAYQDEDTDLLVTGPFPATGWVDPADELVWRPWPATREHETPAVDVTVAGGTGVEAVRARHERLTDHLRDDGANGDGAVDVEAEVDNPADGSSRGDDAVDVEAEVDNPADGSSRGDDAVDVEVEADDPADGGSHEDDAADVERDADTR